MAGKRTASASAKQASPPSKAPRKGAAKAATSPAKERRAGGKKAEAPARAQDARKQADAGRKAEAAAPAAKRKAEEARRRAEAEAAAAQRRREEEEAARKAAEEAARKAAEEAEAKRRADAEAARARAPEALREAREKAEAAEAAAMGLAEQGEAARQAASAAAAENFRASSAASEAQAAAAVARAVVEKLDAAVEEARRALERAEADAAAAREKAEADAESSARLAAEAQAAARVSDERARGLADHRSQERSAASLRSQERSRTAAEMKVLCQHLELKVAAAEDESGACFLEAVADFVQKEIAAAAPAPAEGAAAADDAQEVSEGTEVTSEAQNAAAEPTTAEEVSTQARPERVEATADQQAAPVAAPRDEGGSAAAPAEAVAVSASTPVALATEAPAATEEAAAVAAGAEAVDAGAAASADCVAAKELKEAEREISEAAAEEVERAAKEAAEEARRIAAFAMLGVSIVTAEPKKVTGLGLLESQPVAQPQGCSSGSSGACSSSACGDASCGDPAHATAAQTATQTDASADVDDATTFQIKEVAAGSWAESAAFVHQRVARDLEAQLEALEAKMVQERQAEEAHTAAKARHQAKEEQARPDAAAKEEALKQAQRKKECFGQEVAEMKAVHELFTKVHTALSSSKSPGTEAAALHPRVQKSGALPQDLLTSLGQVLGRKRRAKGDMKVLTQVDTALTDRVRLMSTYEVSVDSEVARCSSEVAAAVEAAQARAKELATFADALAARQEYRRRQEAEVGAARQRLQEHEDRMVAERIMRFNIGPETCMICTEEFSASKCVWLGCNHGWFCKECLRRHVEARLDNGIAGDIPCPSCGDPISEKDLITLLPRKVIFRLHSRTCEQKAVASGARQCPTPNCTWRFTFTDGDDPCQKCPLCEKTSCAHCGAQPYHEGMTCQQYAAHAKEDESLQEWIKATGSKRCPTCGVVTTKENLEKQSQQRVECHKMLCRNCNTKWCFKCCAILTDAYTCGCTQDAHGFIDPNTGKIVKHLKKGTKRKTAE